LGPLLLVALFHPFSAAAADSSEPASQQYAVAAALQNRAAYQPAVQAWSTFIRTYPADSRVDRAYHYLGVCQLKANQPAAAINTLQTAITNYPRSEFVEPSLLQLGMAQYSLAQSGKAEQYDRAMATFARQIGQFPRGKSAAAALFYWGECLYARGKKTEAIAKYAQLLREYPGSELAADALYAVGVSQQDLEQHETAEKTFAQFLAKYPENTLVTEVTMRRGDALAGMKQYEEAIRLLSKAAATKGFTLADYATLRQAMTLAETQQPAEAAAAYAALVKRFPKSDYLPQAAMAGGKIYFGLGQYAAARELFARLLEDPQSRGEAGHWIARGYLKEGNPAEALAAVEKLLPKAAGDPLAATLLMDQADALYELPGRRREAASRYAELAARHGDDPAAAGALYLAGLSALQEQQYAQALAHAQDFQKRYPHDKLTPDVLYVAAESQLQLGKLDPAEKLYAELLQKYPQHADSETWKVRHALAAFLQKKYAEVVALLTPIPAELHTPEAVAEAQYLLGTSQLELGQFAAAAAALEASLKADAKRAQADETRLNLAEAYRQQKQFDKAQSGLRRLLADYPQSRLLQRAQFRLGEYAYAAGDYQVAAREYQQLLKQWPKGPTAAGAWYGLGWARLNLGDYEGAQEAIDKLIENDPHDKLVPRGRYARGMARQQLQKFQPAIEDLQAFLSGTVPPAERSDARYVLALCQSGANQAAQAAATLATLLKEDPQYAAADKVLYEWAWAEKSQAKEKEAAALFARLAADYPHSPMAAESLYSAAEYAYQQADFPAAAVKYQAAMEKAGTTALGEKAAHRLGWCYYRLEQWEKARAALHHQRETWPTGAMAANGTYLEAECLFRLNQFAEALKTYELVNKPTGKDFALLTLLHGAQAAGNVKQWAKDLSLLNQAVRQFPDSPYLPEILCEQGWAQQNLGKPDEAIRLYEQVIATANNDLPARAQFLIGQVQARQKQPAEAVKSFFKVVYGYSYPKWQAQALLEAAHCLETLHKTPEAIKQYRALIAQYPHSDQAPLAKGRLKELQP
jgi:TolA-binding protein